MGRNDWLNLDKFLNLIERTVSALLMGLGHVKKTNFFQNDAFAVFLIGHITGISTNFLQMKVLF